MLEWPLVHIFQTVGADREGGVAFFTHFFAPEKNLILLKISQSQPIARTSDLKCALERAHSRAFSEGSRYWI